MIFKKLTIFLPEKQHHKKEEGCDHSKIVGGIWGKIDLNGNVLERNVPQPY